MSDKQSGRQGSSRGTFRPSLLVVVVAAGSTLVTVALLVLLVDIFEKKQESRNPFFRVVEITDETEDSAVWGKNFPLQYDSYKRTVDMERTRYGGSEALPRTPTQADPRSIIAQSKLEEDPRLKLIWAGYPFAIDFREDRGHAYMLEDQTYTRRQEFGMPGTCIQCHASTYVAYMKAGDGDLIKGSEAIDPRPYAEIRELFTHPIGCIDCHDPSNMSLRVTRLAFDHCSRGFVQLATQGPVARRASLRSIALHQWVSKSSNAGWPICRRNSLRHFSEYAQEGTQVERRSRGQRRARL